MLIATLLAGCVISLMSFGVRGAYGLFTDPLTREMGITREIWAIAIAIQNLCWGIAQPLAGVIADRWGARRVLLMGAVAYALGVVGLVFASTPMQLYLTAGVLTGLGMGGASFITVVAAFGRAMPDTHRSWAMGLGTAAGSLGQFVIVPLVQAAMGAGGTWRTGAWVMAAAIATVVLAALFVRGDRPTPRPATQVAATGGQILGTAFAYPSYLLLVAGFFVCGFQLGFITTHLPAYLSDKGQSASVASWGLAMVGLFNVIGAYMAGVWGGRHSKKALLAGIYFTRAAVLLMFVLMPLSTYSVLLFGAAMGLLWLSTVPLTSGLVATFFGTRYMATLFGIVFFSHQVGSFAGVYMGGYLYERTGSYDVVWWWSIGLSVFAGLVNLPIRESRSQPFSRLVPA
jgi:MFS family permease